MGFSGKASNFQDWSNVKIQMYMSMIVGSYLVYLIQLFVSITITALVLAVNRFLKIVAAGKEQSSSMQQNIHLSQKFVKTKTEYLNLSSFAGINIFSNQNIRTMFSIICKFSYSTYASLFFFLVSIHKPLFKPKVYSMKHTFI